MSSVLTEEGAEYLIEQISDSLSEYDESEIVRLHLDGPFKGTDLMVAVPLEYTTVIENPTTEEACSGTPWVCPECRVGNRMNTDPEYLDGVRCRGCGHHLLP